MELLCIKNNRGDYLRISGDIFEPASISKATVFTISQKESVVTLLDKLRMVDESLHCVKLTISEDRCDL